MDQETQIAIDAAITEYLTTFLSENDWDAELPESLIFELDFELADNSFSKGGTLLQSEWDKHLEIATFQTSEAIVNKYVAQAEMTDAELYRFKTLSERIYDSYETYLDIKAKIA